ncbi:MAG: hypothetical protein ABW163_11060, partial [Luteimonas sp.]
MFINCKHCGSLVATDPASDQPPERCPRCRGVLRSASPAPQVSVASLLKTPSTATATPRDTPPPATAPDPVPGAVAPHPVPAVVATETPRMPEAP